MQIPLSAIATKHSQKQVCWGIRSGQGLPSAGESWANIQTLKDLPQLYWKRWTSSSTILLLSTLSAGAASTESPGGRHCSTMCRHQRPFQHGLHRSLTVLWQQHRQQVTRQTQPSDAHQQGSMAMATAVKHLLPAVQEGIFSRRTVIFCLIIQNQQKFQLL